MHTGDKESYFSLSNFVSFSLINFKLETLNCEPQLR